MEIATTPKETEMNVKLTDEEIGALLIQVQWESNPLLKSATKKLRAASLAK